MNIKKVIIENFKCFKGKFSLELNECVNILVGDNEAGKSTILEAINLALSGTINGKYLRNCISQYLFNNDVINEYIQSMVNPIPEQPPYILIELYFAKDSNPKFLGTGNSENEDAEGVKFKIEFDAENYMQSYNDLISEINKPTSLPIEYYKITWKSFARDSITARNIPLKSALIDSSTDRYLNGSDIYISRIIRNDLNNDDKVGLSQAFRKMKESFNDDSIVERINEQIKTKSKVSQKDLKIDVDLSTQNAWDSTLMTYLDDVPFHNIGKGEQCIIKTNLALGHVKSDISNVILLEEPENHLSYSKLNQLLNNIKRECTNSQVIISTHSSFVANTLNIEKIIFLNNLTTTKLLDLKKDTYRFFQKLTGYQTLRLLLCKIAVLVEGSSDELVFEKAYFTKYNKLPIENGIDVISVGTSFLRFLEIADKINKKVAVITDNDSNYTGKIENKYHEYHESQNIRIFADNRDSIPTLEPQIVNINNNNLDNLREALEISEKTHPDDNSIIEYMKNNKTESALKIFNYKKTLYYPNYIHDAVEWCNE